MVNRPEPIRKRRQEPELDPGVGIQLNLLDYIQDEEEEQQLKNILADPAFWMELSSNVQLNLEESDRG